MFPLTFLFLKYNIFLAKCLEFDTSNNAPALPFNRISYGPVSQLLDITKVFKTADSIKTFGKPS